MSLKVFSTDKVVVEALANLRPPHKTKFSDFFEYLQFSVHIMSILNQTQNKFAYSKDIELAVEHYISNTIS
jgi:hypothetical protein